jgi:A/G-specific adenine glycosylase
MASPSGREEGEVRDVAGLRRALLAWYRRERRDMPWRETRDPYRIWVSEIMLQQTQVVTATPYYLRFVERFPDVAALARAPLDRVLAAWAGLGYYRRARLLHEAARVVVREHAGRVPDEAEAFGALPGVGRYTMGAVLSMGFGRSLPVLDGNVARVFARWTARPLVVKRPADAKVLWAMAERLMPHGRGASPGDWNQALMELGATVCTPRSPRCDRCPVSRWCAARAAGSQEELPPPADRRATVRVRRALARVRAGDRVLLVRARGAHLDGLWEPLSVDLSRGDDAATRLGESLTALGVRVQLRATRERFEHTITHHAITARVWDGELEGRAPRLPAHARWVAADGGGLALGALARRVLAGARPARRRR